MTGSSWTQSVLRHRLLVQSAFATAAIGAASIVLWLRQTPDALLRVDSFVSGLAQVTFWAMDRFSREGIEATLKYLRKLESYKVGRLRRFDRSALDAYLDRQRKIAAEERARRTQSERDT